MAVRRGPYLLDSEKRIQASETKCLRKPLRISYWEHKTNDWIRSESNFFVGPEEPLLTTVKTRKLAWLGHVKHHDSRPKTILRGTFDTVVGRGNPGWITSKSGRPCPCQNLSLIHI